MLVVEGKRRIAVQGRKRRSAARTLTAAALLVASSYLGACGSDPPPSAPSTAGSAGAPRAGSGGARGGSGGAGAGGSAGIAGEAGDGGTGNGDAGASGDAGTSTAGRGGSSGTGAGASTAGTGDGGTTSVTPTAGAGGEAGGDGGAGGEAQSGGEGGLGGEGAAPPAGCSGGQVVPGGEACNGEDDDCDGRVDEGLGAFECGTGACRKTVAACTNGEVGICIPAAPSASVDTCNGEDDDCDGAVDEDCPDCVWVAQNGDDTAAVNGTSPFASLQAAIDFAAAAPSAPPRVCVAAGAACGDAATYEGPPSGDLTMRDGIDVLGNYRTSDWTRCPNSITRIALRSPAGVLFPAAVATPTVLDGFHIQRFADAQTTTGVTVDGAGAVLLSNLTIVDGPEAPASYGVQVLNRGSATIYASEIDGGRGLVSSVGVRATGARVSIQDSCPDIATSTGRCAVQYRDTPVLVGLGVRGRSVTASGLSLGVWLEDAPGSRIERSLVASGDRTFGVGLQSNGVRVSGDATGTLLRGNVLGARQFFSNSVLGSQVATLDFLDCRGATPWVVDNESIAYESHKSDAHTIRASGDCHPVLDSNQLIVNFGVDRAALVVVGCYASDGVPSRCLISENVAIHGAGARTSADAGSANFITTAVSCAAGSCSKITGNQIWGARSSYSITGLGYSTTNDGIRPTGLRMQGGGVLVDRNVIGAGCSGGVGQGVSASGPARIQNNSIFGITEACNAFRIVQSIGLGASGNVDVHSNFIHGGVLNGTHHSGYTECRINGLGAGPGGTYRNNVIRTSTCRVNDCCGGTCPFPFSNQRFIECSYAAYVEPQSAAGIFENNSLEGGNALFLNGVASGTGSIVLDDRASIDANAGWSSTLEACGPYTTTPSFQLSPGSTCIDAGTSAGAPLVDYERQPRDARPDVGPDEAP